MFGSLRLFLASVVVVYHAGFTPLNSHIGVSAVVVFFLLSGFVISGLYETRFSSIDNAGHFYIERIIRIFPQYWIHVFIAVIVYFVFNIWHESFPPHDLSAAQDSSVKGIIVNFTLIPMALEAYFPQLYVFPLVVPAGSLATELLFYLLAPFLFNYPMFCIAAYVISAFVFCTATHGVIPMQLFSYYSFPGPLIFFICGHLLYRKNWIFLGLAILPLLANQLLLMYVNLALTGFNKELYFGLYVGMFCIWSLQKLQSSLIDDLNGAASYGCFLGHFPILATLKHFGILEHSKLAFSLTLLSCSISVGFLTYILVEKPTLKYRRKWRKQSQN